MIIGAHVSTAGGLHNAPLNAKKLDIKAFQIFSKNQNRWKQRPLTDEEIERYQETCKECGIKHTMSHNAYLINLAATDAEKLHKSQEAFLDEMIRADQLHIPYLVMHPGSHLGEGEEAGLRKIADSIRLLINQQPNGKVRILLETTAGQGTNLGYSFEQLAELVDLIDCEERIGICIDTCHIFAAGYDIRTKSEYEKVINHFDKTVGLKRLYAFHLNDSKKELASRVDRHEHIGEGEIGLEGFAFLLNDERFNNIPGVLESPGEMTDYEKNLDILRSLIKV